MLLIFNAIFLNLKIHDLNWQTDKILAFGWTSIYNWKRTDKARFTVKTLLSPI